MPSRNFTLQPVGTVRSDRHEPIDDGWDAIAAHIEIDAEQFGPEALYGLDGFSHASVIFLFDRVPEEEIERGARHPRGNKDWPQIGIFAQRGKNRPNRLGHTICRILRVEGLHIYLEGLDAIDGTPVLDIKPVMEGFMPRGELKEPDWSKELMRGYWV
ncbi:SAM-dependent methyltransferase [Henriciella sp.]|uniref:SAM-dependent methyltransferase n=1 Tax=Henriciella sp. TaxID=1968823 RepID=UPI002615E180|nr:SAM-dependent methyltransferase [Henriciella sp.]